MSSQELAEWHLDINGTQHDAVTLSQVYEYIDADILKSDDFVWHQSFAEWQPASKVFDFKSARPAPPPPPKRAQMRNNAPAPAKAYTDEKRWYQDSANVIAALSLVATIIVGLLSVPFLTEYWQQNLVGGPLDGYKRANAKIFLSAYNGEWCAEGNTPGIPGRVRIANTGADKIKFEFGSIVAPMSIPGSTAQPQFIKSNEGTSKRLLVDAKSAFYVEFDGEIFPGIVIYEQFYREGAKSFWRRYYIKDNKSELIFQANLERCSGT